MELQNAGGWRAITGLFGRMQQQNFVSERGAVEERLKNRIAIAGISIISKSAVVLYRRINGACGSRN